MKSRAGYDPRPVVGQSEERAAASRFPFMKDGLILSGVSLLVYLILGQQALHGFDVYELLRWVDQGVTEHPRHLLYLWVAGAWWGVLELLGMPIYEALRCLSSVGAALGVLLVHRAALGLGLERSRAVIAGGLCAATPAVMHFGSIVEIDGVFFACVGLAWWVLVNLLQRVDWRWAVAAGASTALAASMHAAGHLLVPVFCTFYLAASGEKWGVAMRRLGIVVGTHLVLAGILLRLFGPAQEPGVQGVDVMISNTLIAALDLKIGALPGIVWSEWILAYLPISLLAFAAFRVSGGRSLGVAFSLCVIGYLGLTLAIFGQYLEAAVYLPQGEMVERGSFLLGVCFPAAVLTARSVPVRVGALGIAVGLVVGVIQIQVYDEHVGEPEFVAGAVAVAEAEKIEVICGGHAEYDSLVKEAPWIQSFSVYAITLEAIRLGDVSYEQLIVFFDGLVRVRGEEGRSVLVTRSALETMDEADDGLLDRLAGHLRQRYDLEPVSDRGFAAFRLKPKG